jgi:hypothetical protein
MFDYQAGEKFKLTLIMVGVAGLMAGMFFAMLLMPTPEPARHRGAPRWAADPDVTGRAVGAPQAYAPGSEQAPGPGAAQAQASPPVDQAAGMSLMQSWLPLAWDMSAGSAKQSQEKAITYMTPECAMAYRQNVWTEEIARQIEASGLKSSFRTTSVKSGGNQPDGTMIVYVEGQQILSVPGKGDRVRDVKLEYLVKQTQDGIRVAGISETGANG